MAKIDEETFFQLVESEAGKEARGKADRIEEELKKSLNPEQARMLVQLSDLRCQELGAVLGKAFQYTRAGSPNCPLRTI